MLAIDDLNDLARLMTPAAFEKALFTGGWPHPLRLFWERNDLAREHFLLAMNRAAYLMDAVLGRSDPNARKRLTGDLGKRPTFNAALAEIMWGGRLEAIGTGTR